MLVFAIARESVVDVLYQAGVISDMMEPDEDKGDYVFGDDILDEAGFRKKVENAENGSR